mgnify:CR=1 FL=1
MYVAITPCRLMDTRAGSDNVGPRSTPLGPGEDVVVVIRGSNGACSIPSDAVAVAANVAVVNGTNASYLTLYPTGAQRPLTANLNWVAGAPPTPNKVDVRLGSDGAVRMFNFTGSVDVVIDVFGYYADHTHDDRYYTKGQVDALVTESTDALPMGAMTPVTAPTLPTRRSFVSLEMTTSRPSKLFVTARAGLGVNCSDPYQAVWISIDDVPVPNSLQWFADTFQLVEVSGVTDVVVPAGEHTVEVNSGCPSSFVATGGFGGTPRTGTFTYVDG